MDLNLIVVLGMHRSGTSMITSALVSAGAYAGLPEDLLADQDDNPLGFWERKDVVALDDDVLQSTGNSWFNPPRWADLDPASAAKADANARIGAIFQCLGTEAPHRLAVLKDPRLSVTWPAWASAIGAVDAKFVYVYRSPAAVARSLKKRHGFPIKLSLLLWEIYNRYSLCILAKHGGVAISFESVQRYPEESLNSLSEGLATLGMTLPSAIDVAAFDSQQPSSHQSSDDDIELLLTDSQRALVAQCVSICGATGKVVARDQFEVVEPSETLFSEVQDLANAMAPLATANETKFELERALATVKERTEERDQVMSQLGQTEDAYKKLVSLHEDQVAEHAKLVAANNDLHDEFETLAEQQKATLADKLTLNARLNQREQDFTELANTHEREAAAHSETRERFETLNEKYETLEQAHNQAVAEVNDLSNRLGDMTQKADWLFDLLTTNYRYILSYELSFMGTVGRWSRKGFRLATFRRGRITEYEQAIAEAHQFFSDHNLATPEPPPRKWRQIKAMVRYTLAHPISALRSMSWSRFRKVLQVVRESEAQDLQVWVDARFPEAAESATQHEIPEFDPDTLLIIPSSAKPTVSIIVPAYNEYPVTMRCLASIAEFSTVPFEVILADDCSTDETATITERVEGLVHVRHQENQRFLKNCNLAAKQAKGEFLLFLNNDTTVTEGYLEALLAPMADAQVGITGPKLLFPDGKLQEAGGIVWKDASGWNFGRADNPDLPQYNYRREADYVSGAALMIRAGLWETIGGFDEHFVPAYYEDTDICFEARKRGFKVVYEPTATVIHYEGLSNGTDLAAGQKQYQVVNAEKFATKWREVLERDHFPNAEHVIHARDRSRNKRCVLIMDHYVPHYDKDAGSRSTYGYVQLLVNAGYRVQFMGANFFPHQPYTDKLRAMGVEVLVGEPIARGLDKWLTEHLPYVDHILLHRPHIAEQFLPHLKKQKSRPPITYIGHDLHFLRTQREADLTGNEKLAKEAAKWQAREFDVFKQVRDALYFSQVEIDEIHAIDPDQPAFTIPLYVLDTIKTEQIEAEVPELLFVAGFNHPPNIDAAVWFVEEILPLIKAAHPDVHLHVAGSNPSSKVLALASDTVTVHGYVTDEELAELYARTSCAVVPLRFGAGVKGKVLEAIQRKVPLVTTSVGAEGIPNADTVMRVADEPADFAAAVIDALENGSDREIQAQWVEENFSKERALEALSKLIGNPERH